MTKRREILRSNADVQNVSVFFTPFGAVPVGNERQVPTDYVEKLTCGLVTKKFRPNRPLRSFVAAGRVSAPQRERPLALLLCLLEYHHSGL